VNTWLNASIGDETPDEGHVLGCGCLVHGSPDLKDRLVHYTLL